MPNFFQNQGIEYLNIAWEENDNQVSPHCLLDSIRSQRKYTPCNSEFRNESSEQWRKRAYSFAKRPKPGQLCGLRLLHDAVQSFDPSFKWGFYKTLEFLDSRRPDLEIRRNFFEQLKALAEKIAQTERVSNSWDEIISTNPEIRSEEILLRNTFFNSKLHEGEMNIGLAKKKAVKPKKKKPEKKKGRIKWHDQVGKNKSVESGVCPAPNKQLRMSYNPNAKPTESILKYQTKRRDASLLSNNEQSPAGGSQNEAVDTESEKGNQDSAKKPGLTFSILPKGKDNSLHLQRPKSSHQKKESSKGEFSSGFQEDEYDTQEPNQENERIGASKVQKRLLNDQNPKIIGDKTKGLNLTHSNSLKRLETPKDRDKRRSTPRRKESLEKDKKKTSDSFSKQKEKEETYSPNTYTKPPLVKKPEKRKPGFEVTLDKYRREANFILKPEYEKEEEQRGDRSLGNNSVKKSREKSEVEEKDIKNGNISKNRYIES